MSEPLLNEIRATKPAAPPALHERVRAIAAQEPAREPFLARLEWRRLVLVAPATLAVALVAGTVIGLTRDDVGVGGGDQAVSSAPVAESRDAATPETTFQGTAPPAAGAVEPSPGRLQRYDAELSLRVDDVEDLSRATQQAMRIARSLGGHVAAVSYDSTPGGAGSAQLTLRVPVARATDAVEQLSGLGTILGQRYGIQDLQPTVDDLGRQITETEQRIARLVRQLASTSLVDDERAALQIQLDEARRQLAELRKLLSGTRAEGALATIHLSLTTEDVQATPGGDSRIDDVKDVLAWEAIALLYVLVVAGPLVLLGLLVWLAFRLHRRRENARLLDQP
ncbi:MAG TPA: DUF4349 domain-containing protein [Gaiellaceae bacterium]|nr:DUF4349 domain-containing protein [Gaiellaceae bacterium]